MPFCASCGSPVEGAFCPKCGAAMGAGPAASAAPPAAGYQPPNYAPAAQSGGLSINAASALCYVLGLITGILFLVIAPYNQDRTVRFHAFQCIFFNVAWIALWIVLTIVSMIAASIFWVLGAVVGLLHLVLWLGGLVLWIFMIVKAYQGSRVVLPIVGPLAEKQA